MTTSVLKSHLQMLCFTALLGGSFIASAQISNTMSPILITWLRYAVASLIFIGILKFQKLLAIPSYQAVGRYTLVCLPPLLYFICMLFSVQKTSALDASALYTSVPLMSMLMSVVFLKTKPKVVVVIALLTGLIGALLIIFKSDIAQVLDISLTSSNQLFLFGCLGMGLNPIMVKWMYRGEPLMVMTTWSLICATIVLTMIVMIIYLAGWDQLPDMTQEIAPRTVLVTVANILYLAIFATALSFFLFQSACMLLSATQVAAYVYLIPVSVIVTNIILGHTYVWQELSTGLILVGVAMVLLIRFK